KPFLLCKGPFVLRLYASFPILGIVNAYPSCREVHGPLDFWFFFSDIGFNSRNKIFGIVWRCLSGPSLTTLVVPESSSLECEGTILPGFNQGNFLLVFDELIGH